MIVNNVHELIKGNCNRDELKTIQICSYYNGNYVKKNLKKDNMLCLSLKIKENRLDYFLNLLKDNHIEYDEIINHEYYYIINVGDMDSKNHIIFYYVVNSHILIPQSILKRFGFKKNGWKVNYISYPYSEIFESKIKDYGAEYGYYDMYIEKEIEKRYECKIGKFTKELNDWTSKSYDEENTDYTFNETLVLDIFDMAMYRNPKYLKFYNENSIASKAFGDATPSEFMDFTFRHNFPAIFKDLRANIILNDTEKNFIINKSMISIIRFNESNDDVIIMPITQKLCLALITEAFYNEMKTDTGVCYMYINDSEQIDLINEQIFRFATFNNEDVIGDVDVLKDFII